MGIRGPAGKPLKLKILSGNPGKRSSGGVKTFARGTPNCPTWLGKEAKAEWRRIMPELEAAGVTSKVDRAALAAYCQAWAEFHEATVILEQEGRIIEQVHATSKGEVIGTRKVIHPAVRMQRDASGRVKNYLVEFGLSPASRSRIASMARGEDAEAKNRLGGIRGRLEAEREKIGTTANAAGG
jgi:P27 family predicted phage terminase small subunit